jgi:hypothetical protein
VEYGSAAVRTTYSDGGQHAFWAAFAAKGGSLGEVSRPEALAYAGQEVVVIPARPRPLPVAEAVWSRWLNPELGRAFARSAALSRETPFAPLLTRYADSLPRLVRAELAGTGPRGTPLGDAPGPAAEPGRLARR